MRGFGKLAALCAGVALASPAQAAPCWSDAAYSAAQMRDFDTLLMVQTLRCRINDIDFSADYNRFVRNNRVILADANREIRTHFASAVGRARALGAYDDFMTKIANGYGAGTKGMNCADYAALARNAASAPVKRAALVALAEGAGARPAIPGQRCTVKVALNRGG